MPLTDTAIRNAKPKEKPYKLTDGRGLYILVNKTGKYFRFDYKFQGKRKTLALGVYPKIKLQEARTKHEEAQRLLRDDIDPVQHKKQMKNYQLEKSLNSFEAIAREWFIKYEPTWTRSHARTIIRRLEINIFPYIGKRPITEIDAPELLAELRKIESKGILETAHRVKQICGQIFRYGIATGRANRDPSADLKGALPPTKPKHMATITDPKQVGALLRAIDGYQGNIVTRCAFKLAPLVFLRPKELRNAEWQEINFETAEWKIPAEKMKMKIPHIIPLAKQSIAILEDIKPVTGDGKFVFPSLRTAKRPMSDNTILAALRRMGYAKDEMSGHGFRAMASTILHEQGWPSHLIEKQLAHAERNSIKAVYNYAQYLPERRDMMQKWADYLDSLKKDGEIFQFRNTDYEE